MRGVEIGQTLSHFEVTGKLGEGGMGEVYRARDTKLGREVAIKVLPAAFVDDAERLARFEREARLLASLNHPNFGAIYGLEEDAGRHLLVLELVEGRDLAEVLRGGPLPVEDALTIAHQIAEGLEAAHERGIVHRDLKPANLKLGPEGQVKILDLGLAKAQEDSSGAAPDLSLSPTLTAQMTQAGMILGTAAYMSPEQAAGAEADRRSDVWSFGVVLYEMLTGRRLFEGESVSHLLASVLKDEPDLDALPAATPPAIRRLLGRCLRKKARARLQSIGDARVVLEEVLGGDAEASEPVAVAAAPVPPLWRRALPWGLAGAAAIALVAVLAGRSADVPSPAPRYLEIPLTDVLPGDSAYPAISPDGRWIIYSLGLELETTTSPIHLRSLQSFGAEAIAGTEGAHGVFWSPDSRHVGYFALGELRRLEIATGTSRVICKCAPWGRGGDWAEDGTILFAPTANDPIHRVAAEGGEPTPVTTLDPELPDGSHRYPKILPDGRHFLFTVWSNNVEARARQGGIYLGSLAGGEPRRLLADPSEALFYAPDRLLVQRGGQLIALPFDLDTFEVSDEPVLVSPDVQFLAVSGRLAVSASRTGHLLFAAGGRGLMPPVELRWMDRQGVAAPAFDRQFALYSDLDLTPDGSRFVVIVHPDSGPDDLWTGNFERGTLIRLTRGAHDSFGPRFSPDDEWVAFASERSGDRELYRVRANGSGEEHRLLHDGSFELVPTDWPRDDLLLAQAVPKTQARDAQIWRLDPSTGESTVLLSEAGLDFSQARLSPDGRWLAFVSDESRRQEVYIRSYPDLDRIWQISLEGGADPHWRADSRELVFLGPGQEVLSVAIDAGAGSGGGPGRPRLLFRPDRRLVTWTPVADHLRFLIASAPDEALQPPLRLILDAGPVLRGLYPR